MNWAIYLTTIGLVVTAAGFLHQLLEKKKTATIETLTEKNKWLSEQLELARANSGDILVERLHKRGEHLKAELTQLSTDYEANKALIAEKEKELEENREAWAQVGKELGRMAGDYQDLKAKTDLCPHCESKIIELRDIQDEDWTGSYRKYDCGLVLLDGDTVEICPHDPSYPPFEKLELETKYDEIRKRWSCFYSNDNIETWHLPMTVAHGETESEAKYRMQLIHEGRTETERPTESVETPF